MKKLLFLLFGLLALAGCKKDDPKPKNPAEAVAGQYTLTAINTGSGNVALPYTNNQGQTLSGTMNVAAASGQDAQVNLTLTTKATGQPDESDTLSGVQVQAAGNGYNLVYNGQQVGTADGTNLTFMDGSTTITARK